MVWAVYEELGSLCGKWAQISKLFPSSLLAHVIVEVSKDDLEGRRLELPTDQCYGPTCIPASIDE